MDKPTTIDAYINQFPKPIQDALQQIRTTVQQAEPEAREAIAYGIPTFIMNGNLVHFGAFKQHIGFYPSPSGIEECQGELSHYKGAKGSVQFPLEKPMPLDLITPIVLLRVEKNKNKKKPSKRNATL